MSFLCHFSNLPLTKTYGRLFWRLKKNFLLLIFSDSQCVFTNESNPRWFLQDSQAPVWVWYLPLVGTWNWPLVGVNLDSGGSRTNRWPSDRDPSAIFWNISRNTNNSSPLTQALHKKSQTPSWMWWWAQRGSQGMEKGWRQRRAHRVHMAWAFDIWKKTQNPKKPEWRHELKH